MTEHWESEQMNRLWEHRHYMSSTFYNRLNFFLVFESVLLGVVGILYSKSNSVTLILKMIVLLGLVLTLIWGMYKRNKNTSLRILAIWQKKLFQNTR